MLDRVWHMSYLLTTVRFVFSYKDHDCREHSEEILTSLRAKDMIMQVRCTITMLYNSTMLLLLIPLTGKKATFSSGQPEARDLRHGVFAT